MAVLRDRLSGKVKGATLVEVIVALVLIMTSLSIGIMIVTNTMLSMGGLEELKAFTITEKSMNELGYTQSKLTNDTDSKNVVRTLEPVQGSDKLFTDQVEVYNEQGELLRSSRRIIFVEK